MADIISDTMMVVTSHPITILLFALGFVFGLYAVMPKLRSPKVTAALFATTGFALILGSMLVDPSVGDSISNQTVGFLIAMLGSGVIGLLLLPLLLSAVIGTTVGFIAGARS